MNTNAFIARMRGVSLKEKIVFTRNLALVIKTGMSLPQGLEALSAETSSPFLSGVILSLKEDVMKGKEFSEALARHPSLFNPFYINMVKIGEVSGTMEQVLKTLTTHMEKERSLRSKVLGALTYPAIILLVMILVMIVMMVFAVPRLSVVFKEFDAKLPLPTQIMIGTSEFLSAHLFITITVLLLTPLCLWYIIFRTTKGKRVINYISLKLPLINILTKKVCIARMARTLYTLISSGIPILQALDVASDVISNQAYKKMLGEAREGIEKGKRLNEILKEYPRLSPPLATELVAVGEETGSLDVVLEDLAEFYEDEVDAVTKNMSSIIEPLLMVIIGVGVGFFAISMLQPIYSLTSSIR